MRHFMWAGPTEEDKNYIADTGASPASMMAQTAAFSQSMYELVKKVLPAGGFWWQLMDGTGVQLNPTGHWDSGANVSVPSAKCKAALEKLCVGANASATPEAWKRMQFYSVPNGGKNVTSQGFTDYTAEFLLTRGPYALLGCAERSHRSLRCTLPPSPPSRCYESGCDSEAESRMRVLHVCTLVVGRSHRLVVWLHGRRRDAATCKRVGH
jgi:hypothetical protein